ncbi:hypothetical protein BYT27DRAFT_7127050 [Phlegmacium glaucopus]|nr:hypothetical protein BYT27DRAFT_7127050 [Phlegmacium glaucopus]
MKFTTTIFSIISLISQVATAPIELEKRDVFVPPVLTPDSTSVWKCGSTQTVTWDVSNPPKQITNTKGQIILVKDGMLDFDHPLAKGFDILLGKYTVHVPIVTPGEYQILVFGDSGNTGEIFEIDC